MTFRHSLFTALLTVLCTVRAVTAQPPAPPVAGSTVEVGEINGAAFRVEIPPEWNKGLVMYAHGYTPAGQSPGNPDNPSARALREVFLSRGFAFAESAYSAQGWSVKEGVEDTEALRRHFVAKHGKPVETYITGHSMGGHITAATIERYPEAYQGAMPMCGPLGAAIDFLNNGLFDMLVTFEALFPGTIGSPYVRAAGTAANVKAAIAAHPERAAAYAHRFARPVDQLPAVLAFFQLIAAELKERAGGEPFDNRNRIYGGFGDDAALNRTVTRHAADPAAREYVRQYASPTGRLADPMLAIHTTVDPLVLGSDVSAYEVLAALAGTSDLFVVRFVDAVGHCNFTSAQTGSAFDALIAWARDKKRPEAGEHR
ncbi:MAG TPA: DUF6351 family protein [Vicinamibacterales bacterium]|nr:DUF6351 family protein [Vicinamibacterales bacterium]